MTTAGSATIAYAVEDGFMNLGGDPAWIRPGENLEVANVSLENALQRSRRPDDPTPTGSREGNLEGALSVSFEMTDTNFHDLVFADGGTALPSEAMFAPTATWYVSADVLPGKEERFLAGAAVESASISYSQGEMINVDLTITYADEPEVGGSHGTAPAAGDIQHPDKDEIAAWHGFDLTIDGVEVVDLQSWSLELSGLSRHRRGQSRVASDAVVGAIEPSMSVTAILEDDTQRSLAYGSSTAVEPLDEIEETTATATITNPNGQLAEYTLDGVQPNSFDFSDLVSPDTDTTDPTNYHVADVTVA